MEVEMEHHAGQHNASVRTANAEVTLKILIQGKPLNKLCSIYSDEMISQEQFNTWLKV